MRNYYDILGIHRNSEEIEQLDSIEEIKPSLSAEYFEDVKNVLTDGDKNMHYRRLHLQYDAMAAVLAREIPQQDSNSWTKRLVEFSPEPNDLPE